MCLCMSENLLVSSLVSTFLLVTHSYGVSSVCLGYEIFQRQIGAVLQVR